MGANNFFKYILLGNTSANNRTEFGIQIFPWIFESSGGHFRNYRIYGNTGGVGDLNTVTGKYAIPVTINEQSVNISLDSPLQNGDYIDFRDQKRYNSDNTEISVSLPSITAFPGINKLTIDTDTIPSMFYVQGNNISSRFLYIDIDGVECAGRIKVRDGEPFFEYYTEEE